MAAITGSDAKIGFAVGSAWGTARTAGAGDKFEVESIDINENSERLTLNPIGSGNDMINETQKGGTSPTAPIEFVAQYEGPTLEIASLLFRSTSAAPMAMGDGAYTHSVLYNTGEASFFGTLARQLTSDTAEEMSSCLPTRLRISASNPPAWVNCSTELIGDQVTRSGSNDFSDLESVTLEDSKRIVMRPQDYFAINAQAGGAVSSSDKLDITSIDIDLERMLEHVREIRGASSAANGTPRQSGSPTFVGNITVTLRNCSATTYMAAIDAETEYKAQLNITGDLIGGSNYYGLIINFPRIKVSGNPQYPYSQPNENPYTITFECLVAAEAPTGMIDEYPHLLFTNTRATSALELDAF